MAGKMCASLKAAMGIPDADGDKLAMVALYRVHDGSEHD